MTVTLPNPFAYDDDDEHRFALDEEWFMEFMEGTAMRERRMDDRLVEIARGNVERHLGDVAESADAIYDEAYTLAFDALHDADVPDEEARRVATHVAQCYAQP